jgi:hypothetical protein
MDIDVSKLLDETDLQLEAERILNTEKSVQESSAKTKESLIQMTEENNNIHVLVVLTGNTVSVEVYSTSTNEVMSEYREMLIANCESIISARLEDMVSDRITPIKLAEVLKPTITNEVQSMFGGGS